jgi:alpha/beta superfamily hydrolase
MIEFKDNETVLLGQWFEPKNQENFPAVILATGDGPSGSKGLTWTNIVPKFLEKGIGCFLFDFDGLGHSPNLRRELTLTKGISNIKAAILEMKKNPRLDKTRLAGFGSSFGGNILLLTAHLEDKVESWSKTGFSKEAGFNYSAFLDSYNYNTFKTASLIDIPVKVVHGSKDSAVPLRQSLDLMKFLEKGELYTIEGADHWYSEGNEWEVMAEQLVDYIAKHI